MGAVTAEDIVWAGEQPESEDPRECLKQEREAHRRECTAREAQWATSVIAGVSAVEEVRGQGRMMTAERETETETE